MVEEQNLHHISFYRERFVTTVAVKDVYLPYEEWIEEIAAIEDEVMSSIFFTLFGSPQMLATHKDKYFLRYPHKQSYLAHCIDLQDREETRKAFSEYMIKRYPKVAEEERLITVETTDHDASTEDREDVDRYYYVHQQQDDNDIYVSVDSINCYFNFDIHDPLPAFSNTHFNFDDFYDSRIKKLYKTMCSAKEFEFAMDYPVIFNQDRDACWYFNPDSTDIQISCMQNFTVIAVTGDPNPGYRLMLTIDGTTVKLGDVSAENIDKVMQDLREKLDRGDDTIYPFEWVGY